MFRQEHQCGGLTLEQGTHLDRPSLMETPFSQYHSHLVKGIRVHTRPGIPKVCTRLKTSEKPLLINFKYIYTVLRPLLIIVYMSEYFIGL